MTDFSGALTAPADLTADQIRTLEALLDDAEIIDSVTLSLYPEWVAAGSGAADARRNNGRETWHGIIAELTGART